LKILYGEGFCGGFPRFSEVRMFLRRKFQMDSIIYPYDRESAIEIWEPKRYKEYVAYINRKKITQAKITMPSLEILNDCPTLQFLHISPHYQSPDVYDFSPLYGREWKYLCCLNEYYKEGERLITARWISQKSTVWKP
jgi:hypothetical protein